MLNTLLGRRRPSQKPSNGPPPSKAAASNLRSKTSTNETIDSLVKMRQTIQDLEKRESFLSIKAKAQHEEALAKTKAGDKQGAVAALTRKKMFEKEVMKLVQMKANLEAQILSIESANVTLVAHEGLQAGLNAQKLVAKSLNVDAIADLHQEIEEHLNQQEEVSTILSTAYNTAEVFDEDELLAELQAEMIDDKTQSHPVRAADKENDDVTRLAEMMAEAPSITEAQLPPLAPLSLPEAPSGSINYVDEDVEDELKKLEREMGL